MFIKDLLKKPLTFHFHCFRLFFFFETWVYVGTLLFFLCVLFSWGFLPLQHKRESNTFGKKKKNMKNQNLLINFIVKKKTQLHNFLNRTIFSAKKKRLSSKKKTLFFVKKYKDTFFSFFHVNNFPFSMEILSSVFKNNNYLFVDRVILILLDKPVCKNSLFFFVVHLRRHSTTLKIRNSTTNFFLFVLRLCPGRVWSTFELCLWCSLSISTRTTWTICEYYYLYWFSFIFTISVVTFIYSQTKPKKNVVFFCLLCWVERRLFVFFGG